MAWQHQKHSFHQPLHFANEEPTKAQREVDILCEEQAKQWRSHSLKEIPMEQCAPIHHVWDAFPLTKALSSAFSWSFSHESRLAHWCSFFALRSCCLSGLLCPLVFYKMRKLEKVLSSHSLLENVVLPSLYVCVCVCANSLQSCLTLCDPMEYSPPGSSVHGISPARIRKWIAFPPSRDLPHAGIKPWSPASPALAGGFFTTSASWEAPSILTFLLKI